MGTAWNAQYEGKETCMARKSEHPSALSYCMRRAKIGICQAWSVSTVNQESLEPCLWSLRLLEPNLYDPMIIYAKHLEDYAKHLADYARHLADYAKHLADDAKHLADYAKQRQRQSSRTEQTEMDDVTFSSTSRIRKVLAPKTSFLSTGARPHSTLHAPIQVVVRP